MEGALSLPPERGTIIGRALWKVRCSRRCWFGAVRYVVVGSANREQTQDATVSRMQSNRCSTTRELSKVAPEGIFLSVYKNKDDLEPIHQYSVNSIADCQVQILAHRKQGPALPTLVVNVVPDPALDKIRKRRSSRTTGFTAPKEIAPTALLFRPGDEQHTLHDWARFIQQLIQPHILDRAPLSPVTPASPSFINPFAPRPRDGGDMQNRPDSGNAGSRPGFFLKSHSHTHASRDRPVTFSDSPSLRSKRSDISSVTSSMNQHAGFHSYSAMVPADLPSPATTIGEYQGEFIEGWTSAQGRSSTLSSPVRGRDSVSSQPMGPPPPIPDATPQPGPRETILDRAFQMRRIPGSEREAPGEDKLTSLARFDALMREMDEKRGQREAVETKPKEEATTAPSTGTASSQPLSAWDEDEDEDDSDTDDDDDSDGRIGEADRDAKGRVSAPAPAQRALDFITGRYQQPRGPGARAPPAYNVEALMALSSAGPSQIRPQTGYSNRNRPGMSQRTHSQPHLATILASSLTPLDGSTKFPVPRDSADRAFSHGTASPPPGVRRRSTTLNDKHQSTSSAKRLSFSEFTTRLSSTNSVLLMQANASGGSSRCSTSDIDAPQPPQSPAQHLHRLHPRAGLQQQQQQQQQQPQQPQQLPQSPPPAVSERERCGWRGSVGVFGGGGEGGFL
ncbi:hypothetical protein BT67DRAFT_369560 [Trichocladium antarcticum]|uniref:Uncharacterized protein n=1 Tax=Trichocladium antarcticum TaxID=1450529 RepID=A0AAN6USY9_9PEZI|nr:hypothetical protein BT67DRAFT_369560 [Trichocladium antarcticum]